MVGIRDTADFIRRKGDRGHTPAKDPLTFDRAKNVKPAKLLGDR